MKRNILIALSILFIATLNAQTNQIKITKTQNEKLRITNITGYSLMVQLNNEETYRLPPNTYVDYEYSFRKVNVETSEVYVTYNAANYEQDCSACLASTREALERAERQAELAVLWTALSQGTNIGKFIDAWRGVACIFLAEYDCEKFLEEISAIDFNASTAEQIEARTIAIFQNYLAKSDKINSTQQKCLSNASERLTSMQGKVYTYKPGEFLTKKDVYRLYVYGGLPYIDYTLYKGTTELSNAYDKELKHLAVGGQMSFRTKKNNWLYIPFEYKTGPLAYKSTIGTVFNDSTAYSFEHYSLGLGLKTPKSTADDYYLSLFGDVSVLLSRSQRHTISILESGAPTLLDSEPFETNLFENAAAQFQVGASITMWDRVDVSGSLFMVIPVNYKDRPVLELVNPGFTGFRITAGVYLFDWTRY
jgi:hypothetical protein